MWLSRHLLAAHGFPLCHDHRSSRDPAGDQSPAKVGSAIGNQNQLRSRPGQSSRKHSFGKRVRGVTVRGQSFIDNGLSTMFVTHVPQRRDDWDNFLYGVYYQQYSKGEYAACLTMSFIPFHQDSLKGQCDEARVDHPLAVEAVAAGRHLKIWLGFDVCLLYTYIAVWGHI